MTVYANFADKAAIFEAVVANDSARIDHAFTNLQIGAGSIDVILTRLGTTLMTFLMSPEVMQMDHMLSSEMNRHRGLGNRFYEAGPHCIWQALTDIIAAAQGRGEIAVDDPRQAAEDLIALWLGMVPAQHRFDVGLVVSERQISARVVHGVAVFMKAFGTMT
jgi:TetR/AcrR family transcriptional regulator, mexJK operon transcriptional repressor